MAFQPKFPKRLTNPWRAGLALMCAASLGLMLSGCGRSHPDTVTVRGRITLAGGAWPKPGRLTFMPIESVAGFPKRPGTAEFDVEGNFTAKNWEKVAGLMPGKYAVRVECWDKEPSANNPAGVGYVPDKYLAGGGSGLEVTVEPGSAPIELSWDIPRR